MNEILEAFQDEASEPETTESEVAEKVEGEVEQDDSQEAPDVEEKSEADPPETTSEETEKQEWTFEAVKDERRKRQEAQKELEALKAQLEDKDKPKKETPNVFDDQEAFANHLRDEFRSEMQATLFENQVEMMKEFKPDFDEKKEAFAEAVKENPLLLEQGKMSKNPAKFLYEQGEKYLKFKEMQDVDSYEAKIRAEIEQKLRAEIEGEVSEKAAKSKNLSPSLANARGAVEQEERLPENPSDFFN